MADIVCLGILVADIIARPVDRYPGPGELNLCEEIRSSLGGCAANTGVGLARLGIETAIIGKVGRDGFGEFVRSALEQEGIDTTGIIADAQAPTSATLVAVRSDAERSFVHCVGANATLTPDEVDWNVAANATLLHVAGHFLMPGFDGGPCREVLQEAQQRGLRTSLDTAGHPTSAWPETLLPLLPHLDYLLPSYSEARHCVPASAATSPERVATFFLEKGTGVVALKMGEAGSYVKSASEEHRVPAYRVAAVDATGAGDAFAAGFLAGVLKNLPLEECARLGNAVGALAVTGMGAIAGLLSYEATQRFLSEAVVSPVVLSPAVLSPAEAG